MGGLAFVLLCRVLLALWGSPGECTYVLGGFVSFCKLRPWAASRCGPSAGSGTWHLPDTWRGSRARWPDGSSLGSGPPVGRAGCSVHLVPDRLPAHPVFPATVQEPGPLVRGRCCGPWAGQEVAAGHHGFKAPSVLHPQVTASRPHTSLSTDPAWPPSTRTASWEDAFHTPSRAGLVSSRPERWPRASCVSPVRRARAPPGGGRVARHPAAPALCPGASSFYA